LTPMVKMARRCHILDIKSDMMDFTEVAIGNSFVSHFR
jgi:hypothetical protein